MIELTKLMESKVQVKCLGGREFIGVLRGFDDLVNLVLEDGVEYLRGKCEGWRAEQVFGCLALLLISPS